MLAVSRSASADTRGGQRVFVCLSINTAAVLARTLVFKINSKLRRFVLIYAMFSKGLFYF